MAAKQSIGSIRDVIRSAEFRRNWLTGGTSEEFRKQQVGPALAEKVAELRALVIAPRFAADIEHRDNEVERCERTIARWNEAQTAPAIDNRVCAEGGPRHVFLGSPCCTLCGAPINRNN